MSKNIFDDLAEGLGNQAPQQPTGQLNLFDDLVDVQQRLDRTRALRVPAAPAPIIAPPRPVGISREVAGIAGANVPQMPPDVLKQTGQNIFDDLAMAGVGLQQGFHALGEQGLTALQAGSEPLLDIGPVSITASGLQAKQAARDTAKFFRESALEAKQRAQNLEPLAEEIGGSRTMQAIGQGIPSIAPAIATGPLGAAAPIIASGVQQGLSTLSEAQSVYEAKPQLNREGQVIPNAAFRQALGPALADTVTTAAITAVSGKLFGKGVEGFSIPMRREAIGNKVGEVVKDIVGESLEEGAQQFVSDYVIGKLSYKPEVTFEQAVEDAIQAGIAGGVIGGAMGTLKFVPQQQQEPQPGFRIQVGMDDLGRPIYAERERRNAQQNQIAGPVEEAGGDQTGAVPRNGPRPTGPVQPPAQAGQAQAPGVVSPAPVAREPVLGWVASPVVQYGGLREDQLAQLTPEQQAEMKAKLPAQVEWTDRRVGSPTEGFTVYVPEGATPQQIESAIQAKTESVLAAKRAPEPTEAQKKAGNYPKEHVKVQGLDISIENKAGTQRTGKDKAGNPWSVTMPVDYGYIKRTTGKDGDQVDVYLGKSPDSDRVWIVNQKDPTTGKFDEHKVMMGFGSLAEALAAYDAAFSDNSGPSRRESVAAMTVDSFKDWLKNGNTTKPVTTTPTKEGEQRGQKEKEGEGSQVRQPVLTPPIQPPAPVPTSTRPGDVKAPGASIGTGQGVTPRENWKALSQTGWTPAPIHESYNDAHLPTAEYLSALKIPALEGWQRKKLNWRTRGTGQGRVEGFAIHPGGIYAMSIYFDDPANPSAELLTQRTQRGETSWEIGTNPFEGTPEEVAAEMDRRTDYIKKKEAAQKGPERIVATAVRNPGTGQVLSSPTKIHAQLYQEAGLTPQNMTAAQVEASSGYVTDRGRFVTQAEGQKIAEAQKLVRKGEDLMGEVVAERIGIPKVGDKDQYGRKYTKGDVDVIRAEVEAGRRAAAPQEPNPDGSLTVESATPEPHKHGDANAKGKNYSSDPRKEKAVDYIRADLTSKTPSKDAHDAWLKYPDSEKSPDMKERVKEQTWFKFAYRWWAENWKPETDGQSIEQPDLAQADQPGPQAKLDKLLKENPDADDALQEYYGDQESMHLGHKTVSAENLAKEKGRVLTQQEADKVKDQWAKQLLALDKARRSENGGKIILSLFDRTGSWAEPFVLAGFDVRTIDLVIDNVDVMDINQEWLADYDMTDIWGILSANPCDDFAGSGARWWAGKDESGKTDVSVKLAEHTLAIIEYLHPVFWALENPVGRLSRLVPAVGEPRLQFHPNQYGDPYTKRTQIFGNFNPNLPQANVFPDEASKMHDLRGDDPEQKLERSETPEGFALAFALAQMNIGPYEGVQKILGAPTPPAKQTGPAEIPKSMQQSMTPEIQERVKKVASLRSKKKAAKKQAAAVEDQTRVLEPGTDRWVISDDWRKSFRESDDIETKIDWLRAVANNRGHKASAEELKDVLDYAEQLMKEQEHSRLANTFSDVSQNPAASAETKARAKQLYDDYFKPGRMTAKENQFNNAKALLLDAYRTEKLVPGKGIQLVQLHTSLSESEAKFVIEEATKEFQSTVTGERYSIIPLGDGAAQILDRHFEGPVIVQNFYGNDGMERARQWVETKTKPKVQPRPEGPSLRSKKEKKAAPTPAPAPSRTAAETAPSVQAARERWEKAKAKVAALEAENDKLRENAKFEERESILRELEGARREESDAAGSLGLTRARAEYAGMSTGAEVASDPKITPKVLKTQKEYLLAEVNKAIKDAPEEGNEKITISVPGDGEFTIFNNKATLKKFRDENVKLFPTTVASGGLSLPSTSARAVPKVEAGDPAKVAGMFVSDDQDRYVLTTSYSDGQQIISTDGRQMIRIVTKDAPGTPSAPVRIDEKGKVSAKEDYGNYPNYNQVIPKDPALLIGGADTAKLLHVARQAEIFRNTSQPTDKVKREKFQASTGLQLFLNPDKSIGGRMTIPEHGEFEHNVQPKAISLGSYNPDYIINAMTAARQLGNERVDLFGDADDGAALVIRGKSHENVIMGLKGDVKMGRQPVPASIAGRPEHAKIPLGYGPLRDPESLIYRTTGQGLATGDWRVNLQGGDIDLKEIEIKREQYTKTASAIEKQMGTIKLADWPKGTAAQKAALVKALNRPEGKIQKIGELRKAIDEVVAERSKYVNEAESRKKGAAPTEAEGESLPSMDDEAFARFQAAMDERNRENEQSIAANLEAAGDRGVVRLVRTNDEGAIRTLIVAPSPDPDEAGMWRVTSFDDHGPWGHHVFKSREAALRAASGESHSDMVPGPTYYSPGSFKVEKVAGNLASAGWTEVGPAEPQGDTQYHDLLSRWRTADEVIGRLLLDKKTTPFQRELLQRLRSIKLKTRVKLGTEADKERLGLPSGSGGVFNTSDVIYLFPSSVNNFRTLLHEFIHAATLNATRNDPAFAAELQEMLEQAKKSVPSGRYGLTNIDEFLAEAFSNPEFQADLKKIKSGDRTLWEQFVDWVRKVLGMESTQPTLLQEVIELGSQKFAPLRATSLGLEGQPMESLPSKDELRDYDVYIRYEFPVPGQKDEPIRVTARSKSEAINRARPTADAAKDLGVGRMFLRAVEVEPEVPTGGRNQQGAQTPPPVPRYLRSTGFRGEHLVTDETGQTRQFPTAEEADAYVKEQEGENLPSLPDQPNPEPPPSEIGGPSLADIEGSGEVEEAVQEAAKEGLLDKTQRMGVVDRIKGRQHLTPAVRDQGRAHAMSIFAKAGLQVQENEDGWLELTDPKTSQEAEGQRLLKLVKDEIGKYQTDQTGFLGNLINSVRNMAAENVPAFSDSLNLDLYAATQGEASHRGLMLAALAGLQKTIAYVGRRVRATLHKEYYERFGGEAVAKVVEKVKEEFAKQFPQAEVDQVIKDNPKLQETFDKAVEQMLPDAGGRLYRKVQNYFKPRKVSKKKIVDNALLEEAFNEIIEQAKKLGLTAPEQPKKKLTPREQLAIMAKPETVAQLNEAIEQAVIDAEFNAGRAAAMKNATTDEEKAAIQEEGWEPSEEDIAEGMELPKFAHWKEIRDHLLEYSPTTMRLIENLIRSEFKGTEYGKKPNAKEDLRIDFNKLAVSPEAEVQRVLKAYYDGIEATVKVAGSTPEMQQRVLDLVAKQVGEQLDKAKARAREPMFKEPVPVGRQIPGEKEMNLFKLVNAGLFLDPRLNSAEQVKRVALKSPISRFVPNLRDLITAALETPFYRQGDLGRAFADELVKRLGLPPNSAVGARSVFNEAFGTKFRKAREIAMQRVEKALTPQERREMSPKKATWKKITEAVNAGVFDTSEILQRIAKAHGWNTPTEDDVKEIRDLVEKMERMRELTQAERDAVGDDPVELQRAAADKAAVTLEKRVAIKKKIEAKWAKLTHPFSFKSKFGIQNIAAAINEMTSANLLLKVSFPFRQIIDVMTQGAFHTPTRAIQAALERHGIEGNQQALWKEVGQALGDAYRMRAKSYRAALQAARDAFAGTGEARNVDRLMSRIALFDRAADQADQLEAQGKTGQAAALRLFTYLRLGFRIAQAMDNIHGLPAEYQEMRQQVVTALRENGQSPAEAFKNADAIIGDMKAEHQLAVARAQQILESTGEPFTANDVKGAAWQLVKGRAYQRMREAGLPADAFEEENRLLRSTVGWNEREQGGLGGVIAGTMSAGKAALQRGGIPMPLLNFANAIGTSINRSLSFTPLGFFPGLFEGSPWYKSEADKTQRKVEAAVGTSAGTALMLLVLAGALKVRNRWPRDKEERELWEREGHRPGTVEINLGDGDYMPLSLTTGPLTLVRPWLAAAGAVRDAIDDKQKAQDKLNAEAAKRGLPPGQVEPMGLADLAAIAGDTAWGSIVGGRTAAGLIGSVSDYGTPNIRKTAAALIGPMLPTLPMAQEFSRMAGVRVDPKLASFQDFLLPLPTSKAAQVNLLGDPVGNDDAVQRVTQILSGGSGLPVDVSEKQSQTAYLALYASEYRPPSISPGKGYSIDGEYRPMTDDELAKYTKLRGQYFKEELANLGETPTKKEAAAAFKSANDRALSEVGASVPEATTTTGTTTVAATRVGPTGVRTTAVMRRPTGSSLRSRTGRRIPARAGTGRRRSLRGSIPRRIGGWRVRQANRRRGGSLRRRMRTYA